MKKINKILAEVRIFSEYAVVVSVMIILGMSLFTKTPILEITEIDSQWWILLVTTMIFAKLQDKE